MGRFLDVLGRILGVKRPGPVVKTVTGPCSPNEQAPEVNVMVESLADKRKIVRKFKALLESQGTTANSLQTFQGEEARRRRDNDWFIGGGGSIDRQGRTRIQQSRTLAKHVYRLLRDKLDNTAGDLDWFFVFHPDTMWHLEFNTRIKRRPLDDRFCGYTSCLDTAVVFLCAIRDWETIRRQRGQRQGRITLHLIIPANQQLLIPDYVSIPPRLAPLFVEGVTHGSLDLVALNIPEHQSCFLSGIENWEPEPVGFMQSVASFFTGQELPSENDQPRELGMASDVESSSVDENSSDEVSL